MLVRTLRNPVYAGAYVFGKSEMVRGLDPEDPTKLRCTRRAREQWRVLIREHHEGYISYDKYLENRKRLRDNVMMNDPSPVGPKGAAREGPALLQGLVRCGQCGRLMSISYGGQRRGGSHRVYQYRCCAKRGRLAGQDCQLNSFKARIMSVWRARERGGGQSDSLQQAGRQIASPTKLGPVPAVSGRCSPGAGKPSVVWIFRTSCSSVLTARTRIGAEHRGQTSGSTSYREALGQGPAGQHASGLDAQVVVQAARLVAVHPEAVPLSPPAFRLRLGGLFEIANRLCAATDQAFSRAMSFQPTTRVPSRRDVSLPP